MPRPEPRCLATSSSSSLGDILLYLLILPYGAGLVDGTGSKASDKYWIICALSEYLVDWVDPHEEKRTPSPNLY